ncbi:sulfatase [Luteolibacter algae]|uniref:Sulfatase n=1 Tax=Luteolibacter algae TaxID=454151 RepID=A0ABW5D6Y8_9BACT
MRHSRFSLLKFLTPALALCVSAAPVLAGTQERPNVVWIISDDLGPELGCWGYPGVSTPNIDRLAREGTRYTQAFSSAPVCSASRTAFQTGQYQTTVGGHHHETHDKPVLTDETPTVVGLMREAGYFTSNGDGTKESIGKKWAKSHFNFVYKDETFFDGQDWSQRAEGQPFFAQVQIKEPHRDFVENTKKRPLSPIPPYYPEHPVTRADWDNYLASIEVLDRHVGEVLDRLDAEGLTDDTLVFFFGDHGRPHVRDKQWLYEGGLHTPMIARWPGKVPAGVTTDHFASLLDLMPTTLVAAGAKLPELPGKNLFAPDWKGHEKIFAARDRCGDAVDRIRSVRNSRFKYIRNYHPEKSYMQLSSYKKLQYPVDTLMRILHAEGKWDGPFMAETRPVDELYDLKNDPYELNNLAANPDYAKQLKELSSAVDEWIVDTGDKGEIEESLTVDLPALFESKRISYYEGTMKKRGLDPAISDKDYLDWWQKELHLDPAKAR